MFFFTPPGEKDITNLYMPELSMFLFYSGLLCCLHVPGIPTSDDNQGVRMIMLYIPIMFRLVAAPLALGSSFNVLIFKV